MTIAILTAVGKVGIEAVLAFLKNRGSSIDDAIKALEIASTKSLEQYKAEDLAARLPKP